MDILKAFAEKVQSDENLQNEIKKLSEANDKEGLIVLLKSKGVSDERITDILNFNVINGDTDELNDAQLDQVSAGNGLSDAMLAAFGGMN